MAKLNIETSEVYKNVESESFSISQDEESLALQFKLIVSNLYADPLTASIREIISNALDANKESGSNLIEIIEPDELSEKILWIRDYGLGISPEVMKNQYLKVFSSTKRSSNEQIGAYGIGRLSCLALAQQFPIETFVNGVKYQYVIFLNEKGIPDCALINQEKTEEDNGTTVGIPIEGNLKSYKESILKFLFYSGTKVKWNKNQVYESRINNASDEILYSSDLITIYKDKEDIETDTLYLNLGGIIYPLISERKYKNSLWKDKDLSEVSWEEGKVLLNKKLPGSILHIPLGELDLSSSRESILDNSKNRKIIEEYKQKASKEVATFFHKWLENIKTPLELFQAMNDSCYLSSLCYEKGNFDIGDWSVIRDIGYPFQNSKVIPLYIRVEPSLLYLTGIKSLKRPILKRQKRINRGSKYYVLENIEEGFSTKKLLSLDEKVHLIIHEANQSKNFEFYQNKVDFDPQKEMTLILLVGKESKSIEERFPSLINLQELGFKVDIIRSKVKATSSKKSKSKTEKPLGKCIRPLEDLDMIGGSYWIDYFNPTPLGYVPQKGLFCSIEDDLNKLKAVLPLLSLDEKSKLYFVQLGAVSRLPKTFQSLEDYLSSRKKARNSFEVELLELANVKREIIDKFTKFYKEKPYLLKEETKKYFKEIEKMAKEYRSELVYENPYYSFCKDYSNFLPNAIFNQDPTRNKLLYTACVKLNSEEFDSFLSLL